jgi:alpha/beta superfamily hydrolase
MSVEKRIHFLSGSLKLEGLYAPGEYVKGAVVSHPHPLYGGDMENDVVHLITRTLQGAGWTTLRFNFRGVGESQGTYDEGMGEREDVAAAVAFLKDKGLESVVLAGYSFGAWVNARAALDLPEITSSVLVSPPVDLMDFSFLKGDHKTRLIIVGDKDPFASVERLRALVKFMGVPPEIRVIPGADHFFSVGSKGLMDAIQEVLPRL